MSVSVVGTPTFSSTQASTTLSITLPSGIQSGDYIVLLVGNGEDNPQPSVTTAPSGFTAIGTIGFLDYGPGGITQHIYYKVATGSDPTPSITWNTGDSNGGGLWALAVALRSTIGWHPTTPVSLEAQGIDAASSSNPAPPDFVLDASGYCLHFLQTSDNNNSTLSTANGWTLRGGGNTTDGTDGSIHVADQTFATAGTKSHPIWALDLGPDYYGYRTLHFRENLGDAEASGSVGTVTTTTPAGSATGSAVGSGAVITLTVTAPTGSAAAITNGDASGAVGTITLSVVDATATGTATASGDVGTVTTSAVDATVSAEASTSGAVGTVSVTTPDGSPSAGANASGDVGTVQLTAPTGSASAEGNADATGALVTLTVTAPDATATASASATGSVGTITLSKVNGNAYAVVLVYRYPNEILSMTGLTGSYTDIDESPDAPDGSWLLVA